MKQKPLIRAKIKNAWDYKRTALLWTVILALIFLFVAALFLQFSDAYFSSDAIKELLADERAEIYVLLDDYVLLSFLLLLYALCG